MPIDPVFWNVDDQAHRAHYRGRNHIGRALLHLVDDSGVGQVMQLELNKGEVRDKVQFLGHFGFGSVPLTGASAFTSWQGGHRGFGTVSGVVDGRYRPKDYKGGESYAYMVDGEKGDGKGAKADGTGGKLRKLWEGVLGWKNNIFGKQINVGTGDDTDTITITAKTKIVLKCPLIVLDGEVRLGGEDASKPASMQGTVDSHGDTDVSNFATKVKLK